MAQEFQSVDFRVLAEDGVIVRVSSRVYSLQALMKAAYQYTGKYHVHIEPTMPDDYRVQLKHKQSNQELDLHELAGEFCNTLLDFSLRESIAKDSEPIRNLILANAFSRTSLIEPDLEVADYTQDPRGIAQQDKSR